MLTLGQAAKLVGVSKTTLSKAIAKGRISAGRSDTGTYQIDPAELTRVYPVVSQVDGQGGQDKTLGEQPVDTQVTPANAAALKAEIEGLKAQLALMKDQVTDLKDQRDGWQKQAEAHQRLLQDMRPEPRRWFSFGKAS
jgi:excisionase family DNA binding protein